MYYKSYFDSPIGRLMVASDEESLVGVWMDGQKYFGNTVTEEITEKDDQPILVSAKKWLNHYFAGEKPEIEELSLSPKGSLFRQEVWAILKEIPYGQTITYGDIAQKMAKKQGLKHMSGQAVGGAVGHNPLSIIIPCHRVVGANGSITGYAGGCDKKIKLLQLEGVDMSGLFVPKKGTAL